MKDEIIKLQQQLINNLTLQLLFPEPTTRKAEKNYVLLREKEEKLRDKISELSEGKDHSVDVNETISEDVKVPFNFVVWYSGMEARKVQNAYMRYLKETNKYNP